MTNFSCDWDVTLTLRDTLMRTVSEPLLQRSARLRYTTRINVWIVTISLVLGFDIERAVVNRRGFANRWCVIICWYFVLDVPEMDYAARLSSVLSRYYDMSGNARPDLSFSHKVPGPTIQLWLSFWQLMSLRIEDSSQDTIPDRGC